MRHLYIFLFVMLCGQQLYSQSVSVKQSLFYQVNAVASPGNMARLDSLLQFAGQDSVTISIQGYADFLGNPDHNILLSQQRAEAAKDYLLKNNGNNKIALVSCKGFGETHSQDNRSPEGEPYQRRVDVLVVKTAMKKNTVVAAKARPVAATVSPIAEKEAVTTNGAELLDKGQSMEIKGLFFIPGRHTWTRDSETALASLLKTMQDFPDLKIEIQGHICCIEGPKDALDFDTNEIRLSHNRAQSVYDYLVLSGIDAGRMIYKGYGHSQPKVAQELNSFHEQMNRRVEIKVLEK